MKTFFFLLFAPLIGCGLFTTRPSFEMSLAATSFMAAKDANAQKFSPYEFQRAEYYFLKAKSFYKKKFFNTAKHYALRSQRFSEKAEEISMRKATLEKY